MSNHQASKLVSRNLVRRRMMPTPPEGVFAPTLAGLYALTVPDGTFGTVFGSGFDSGCYQYIGTLDGGVEGALPFPEWLPCWFTQRKLLESDVHGVKYELDSIAARPARAYYSLGESLAQVTARWSVATTGASSFTDTGSAFRLAGRSAPAFASARINMLPAVAPTAVPRICLASCSQITGNNSADPEFAGHFHWRFGSPTRFRIFGIDWNNNNVQNSFGPYQSVGGGFGATYGTGFPWPVAPFTKIMFVSWDSYPTGVCPVMAYPYLTGPDPDFLVKAEARDLTAFASTGFIELRAIGGSGPGGPAGEAQIEFTDFNVLRSAV